MDNVKKVPIIDITDLYHPAQDPGDNFDIIAAYALPEIDLRAVILDATERFRQPIADGGDPTFRDTRGYAREPGVIPMTQMNFIFNRNVPYATSPFTTMKSPDDCMYDVPVFQQYGIELILKTLQDSEEKVEILSFGSARTLAAAYNREPDLLRSKVKRIHLSAGSSSPEYPEWNVLLDPNAIVCLFRSDLPIAVYPCATGQGPFDYSPNNSFWRLPNLEFIKDMHPKLKRYLGYAFGYVNRVDFLRAVQEDFPEEHMQAIYPHYHSVWETAVWMQVSNRVLVHRADGSYRIIPADEVLPTDSVLPNELRPCKVNVQENGRFTFEYTDEPTNLLIYYRGEPYENEKALREALPALYLSINPDE
jgi:pyrimidine-specific ribonucleoside hydrolase